MRFNTGQGRLIDFQGLISVFVNAKITTGISGKYFDLSLNFAKSLFEELGSQNYLAHTLGRLPN